MLECQPVCHVADVSNLLCAVIDEIISVDENTEVMIKISADHGLDYMKVGMEVHIY